MPSSERGRMRVRVSGAVPPPHKRGRRLRLSLQRRWMSDLMAASRTQPVVAAERTIRVASVIAARRAIPSPPGWTAILLKAYALVSVRRPELRQAYLSVPWPHVYEHPCSVATVVIEREWRGEHGVFLDQIIAPELKPLTEIDSVIRGLRRNPVESVGGYRRLIRFTRLPRPVRRSVWWFGLRCSGRLHARYFGTFSINSIGLPRAGVVQTTTPITMSIIHMPLEPNGQMRLCGAFDHRLLDGMAVGRALGEMEAAINDEIVAELRRQAGSGLLAAAPLVRFG